MRGFQWYKDVWFGQSFSHLFFWSNVWELVPWGNLVIFCLKCFSLIEIIPWRNLVPFSLMEHGWGYHFVSFIGKVLFSLGHLAWWSWPKAFFFHPFFSWKRNRIWKKDQAFNPLFEGGGGVLTIGYEFIFFGNML